MKKARDPRHNHGIVDRSGALWMQAGLTDLGNGQSKCAQLRQHGRLRACNNAHIAGKVNIKEMDMPGTVQRGSQTKHTHLTPSHRRRRRHSLSQDPVRPRPSERVSGYRNGGEAIEEGRGSTTQPWYSGQVGGIVDAGAKPSPRMMHACMLTWRFRSWAVIVIIIKGRHPCTCVAGLRQ